MEPIDSTLVIKLGYRGAAFSGFAAQPGRRTVAGCLERALTTYLRRDVELTCAGRTDAGVHAVGQYVSLPASASETDPERGRALYRALAALTPDDISIRGAFSAAPGFSARFDAIARSYRYRIVCGAEPVLLYDAAWWCARELDTAAMHAAARALVGEHDFKSFCKAASAVDKPTHRFVASVDVYETEELGERCIAVDVTGNAFLHSMVRTIVGTLAEVGAGRRDEAWVADALAACDRAAAGPCAPAKGLCFMDVAYPDGALTPLWPRGF